MADGKIRIDTELNNDKIADDLRELQDLIIKGVGGADDNLQHQLNKLVRQWEKYAREIENIQKEMAEAEAAKPRALADIGFLEKQIEQLGAVQRQSEAQLATEMAKTWNKNKDKIKEIQAELRAIANETKEYEQAIKKANTAIERGNKSLEEGPIKIAALKLSMEGVGLSAANLLEKLKENAAKMAETGSATDKSGKFMGVFARETGRASKSASQLERHASGGVKKLAKYLLAMFGIRSVYQQMVSLSNRWLNSEDIRAQQIKANLEYIKTSISNSLAPIIIYLTDLVMKLFGYISAILGALFGWVWPLESATDGIDGMNKGLKGAAKNAKDLNKQMAGFDEMNVLTEPASGGGGGGGPEMTMPVIETPDISGFLEAIQSIIDAFQPFIDIIKGIDWEPMITGLKAVKEAGVGAFGVIKDSIVRVTNNALGPFIKLLAEDLVPAGLNTFASVLELMTPIIANLLENFIEPLVEWFLLDFAPVAWELMLTIWEAMWVIVGLLIESFMVFWEWLGKPIATFAWGLLEAIMKDLNTIIKEVVDSVKFFLEKLKEGDPFAQALAFAIGTITAALIAYKVAQVLVNIATAAFAALQAVNPFTWVVLAIAAIIAIILVLYKNWDSIKEFFKTTLGNIKEWFGSLGEKAKEVWDNIMTRGKEIIEAVRLFFSEKIEAIKGFFTGLGTKAKEIFIDIKTKGLEQIEAIRTSFKEKIDRIKEFFTGLGTKAAETWTGIKDKFFGMVNNIYTKFQDTWTKIKGLFSQGGQIFSGLKDGIVNVFKIVVNTLIDGINRIIAVPFRALNTLLDGIRSVSILKMKPFSWVPSVPIPVIPKLARGGIVNRAMTAEIGEGRYHEAVIPLDKDNAGVQRIADLISGNMGDGGGEITIVNKVYLDGKQILETIEKAKKDKEFRTNGRLNYGY